ncbi:hypothetical protein [Streptomyces sp. NPDC008121]|uniref:hypothetical protein n=1 Tax=Streptomyces sp. NPDC008121 TaxID=3364809 RepID=UPI0036E77AEB
MNFARKAALVAVVSGCLTAGVSGGAFAAGTASKEESSSATASPALPEAGPEDGAEAQSLVSNTVELTNKTGHKLTLTDVNVRPEHRMIGWHFTYDQAIQNRDGLWRPAAGDTLEAGEKGTYAVTAFAWNTPEVRLTFEDEAGREITYGTRAWTDGGSSIWQDSPYDTFKLDGENARPGNHTILSIVNR